MGGGPVRVVVRCWVRPPEGVALAGAVVEVVVEDAGVADRAAPVVARRLSVLRPGTEAGLFGPVEIAVALDSPSADRGEGDGRQRRFRPGYNVRVHVDRDGDGAVGIGDLVSFRSHPLPGCGSGMERIEMEIPVEAVG